MQNQFYLPLREKFSLKKTFVKTNFFKKKIIRYGINEPKLNKSSIRKNFIKI